MLVDLEEYQREKERIIAEFDIKIANLEDEISRLVQEILEAEEQISIWTEKVEDLQTQVATWQQRKESADFLYDSLVRNYKWEINNAVLAFNSAWDGYARVKRVNKWWLGTIGFLLDYVHIWMPLDEQIAEYANQTVVRNLLVNHANTELSSSQTQLSHARASLSSWEHTLESKTRHSRDLQLAKEAAEEEKRGALSLWEAEYQAAIERKRIEIASIARDIVLGYPTMEAYEAQQIAETAYGDALARGFTRLADAIEIASTLAQEWWDRQVTPGLTTTTIRCPSCNVELRLTTCDIPEYNRPLTCPKCASSIGQGWSVSWVYVPEPPTPPTPPLPIPPIAGVWEWAKKYAPWIGVAGLGGITIYAATKKK
ncbi:hypothetical protein ES702_07236 [subsurface metagenome]